MSYVESKMIELETKAPDFSLPDTISGEVLSLESMTKGAKATVIMFLCNHCPYVIHVNEEIVKLTKDYKAAGVAFIGISSNDVINYPQDRPELMTTHASAVGYDFPYLYDESQEVAKAYDAACTPDFYIFDQALKLKYRGRLDNSKPNSGVPLTGADMRSALDAVLSKGPVAEKQYPSGGCNIKWKN